jgi:hypothetical protein
MVRRKITSKQNALASLIANDGDKRDLFIEIGRFIFEYSQLEFDLRQHFRRKIGFGRQFNDVMSAGFDFARLCNALKAISAIEEGGQPHPVLAKHLKSCMEINDIRVAVVHGHWVSTLGGDTVVKVSVQNMKRQRLLEKDGELARWSDAIKVLRADIADAIEAADEQRKIRSSSTNVNAAD